MVIVSHYRLKPSSGKLKVNPNNSIKLWDKLLNGKQKFLQAKAMIVKIRFTKRLFLFLMFASLVLNGCRQSLPQPTITLCPTLTATATTIQSPTIAIIPTHTPTATQTPVDNTSLKGYYVNVNGASLWVESEGKGETVLLIAGGPGVSHDYFQPYFSQLADYYRVIYYDAFGRGQSEQSGNPGAYSFDRDVEDIETLRTILNLGELNLFGHSYGGMVAQAYALKYPQSVQKLVLSNTFIDGEAWQANNDNYNNEIRNQYPREWAQILDLRARGFLSSSPEHQEIYHSIPDTLFYYFDASNAAKVMYDWNPDVYYAIAGEDADFNIGGDIVGLDFRGKLSGVDIPTLIIAGRFDRVSLPREQLVYTQYMPQAEFVLFEKSGHYPFIEEESEFFFTLMQFFEKP